MSDEYEKPTVTPLGQLGPNGELPPAAAALILIYAPGDFVWARNNHDGTGTRWLACIESPHSVRSFQGRRWLVRVRRRTFWSSGSIHMYVDRKLSTNEVADNRRLGLIPPEGAPL